MHKIGKGRDAERGFHKHLCAGPAALPTFESQSFDEIINPSLSSSAFSRFLLRRFRNLASSFCSCPFSSGGNGEKVISSGEHGRRRREWVRVGKSFSFSSLPCPSGVRACRSSVCSSAPSPLCPSRVGSEAAAAAAAAAREGGAAKVSLPVPLPVHLASRHRAGKSSFSTSQLQVYQIQT